MKVSVYILVFGILAVLVVAAALSASIFDKSVAPKNVSLSNLKDLGPAPNIRGISAWINSAPLSIEDLKGKVVLVDFWTYSCINCIRTIPYLNALESKYGNSGLVIIGVHTPEFQFEKNYTNVKNAVQRFGIRYAVALDNNYSTWGAYSNEYWPADYIIDKTGNIRYTQFGEGDYNTTDMVIRELLGSAGYNINSSLVNFSSNTNFSQIGTPEIYLGYGKARSPIGNTQGFVPNQVVNYSLQNITEPNIPYFVGQWYNQNDSMISVSGSRLFLVYKAKDVDVVAGGNSSLVVKLDGENMTRDYLGSDARLVDGAAVVHTNSSRLYNIVAAPSYGVHVLEIDASPGFKVYTFTFG